MRKDPVVILMENGDRYLIQPMVGEPHRIYRVVEPRRGNPQRVRVTDKSEIVRVAARFSEIYQDAKKNVRREKLFGKRLVSIWRWAMVFIDKVRTTTFAQKRPAA